VALVQQAVEVRVEEVAGLLVRQQVLHPALGLAARAGLVPMLQLVERVVL